MRRQPVSATQRRGKVYFALFNREASSLDVIQEIETAAVLDMKWNPYRVAAAAFLAITDACALVTAFVLDQDSPDLKFKEVEVTLVSLGNFHQALVMLGMLVMLVGLVMLVELVLLVLLVMLVGLVMLMGLVMLVGSVMMLVGLVMLVLATLNVLVTLKVLVTLTLLVTPV